LIELTEGVLQSVHAHAARSYRDEACGILLGTAEGLDKTVLAAVPMDNRCASTTRDRSFLMSASDYRWAEMLAERKGLTLVGIYHSHPDHPALASERDRIQALPFFSYVIVSVVAAEPRQTRSFVLSDDRSRFNEETIALLETDSR
jgi:proteasome lid subunit RPN8/RPN11